MEVLDGGAFNDGSTPGSADVKVRSSRDVVMPLTHLSYPDQLEQKTKSISQILKKLVSTLAVFLYELITDFFLYF